MEENIYCVYMHTSPVGKSYIGMTKDYKGRCIGHKYKNSPNTSFREAILEFGWDDFTHKIIEDKLDKNTAEELESFLIEECNTLAPNGYNLRYYATNGKLIIAKESSERLSAIRKNTPRKPTSEETRRKISESHKGDKNSFYGKTHSEETILKMRGRVMSEEAKNKVSESKLAKRVPYDELPITIEEAIGRGLSLIKQTVPCEYGHLYARGFNITSKKLGSCLSCRIERSKEDKNSKSTTNKLYRRNTSGYMGVSLTKRGTYKSVVRMKEYNSGKEVFLGYFITVEEAALVRELKFKELKGDEYYTSIGRDELLKDLIEKVEIIKNSR
jgi:group I intron endonuclease